MTLLTKIISKSQRTGSCGTIILRGIVGISFVMYTPYFGKNSVYKKLNIRSDAVPNIFDYGPTAIMAKMEKSSKLSQFNNFLFDSIIYKEYLLWRYLSLKLIYVNSFNLFIMFIAIICNLKEK